MTALAKPNQIVIGQLVYDALLDSTHKGGFTSVSLLVILFIIYMAVFD
jgi:hypothetical protein